MNNFVAVYMPKLRDGETSPTHEGFSTREEAWQWVFDNHMCDGCVEERNRALIGSEDETDSKYPACSAEWEVISTKDWDHCESFMDVLEAAGYVSEIENEGRQSFLSGKSIDDNPYEPDTDEETLWDNYSDWAHGFYLEEVMRYENSVSN